MPNQSYCGAREDFKMADCSLPLPYSTVKPEEKFCRYSYASWCPTCDKESPRRRTRSETSEPCRRKGKEMKTFTPKKYSRCQEYENMELECNNKDVRFDCCRIRSNLCELPTTYISNNCQIFSNTSNLTNVSSGNSDYFEKPPKLNENSFKLFDFNNTGQNLFMMNDKQHKNVIKNGGIASVIESQKSPNRHDNLKCLNTGGLKNLSVLEYRTNPQKTDIWVSPKFHSIDGSLIDKCELNYKCQNGNNCERRENLKCIDKTKLSSARSNLLKPNLNCNIIDIKYRQAPENDTCTLFDKKEYDISSLNERYYKEVQILRSRLQDIRKSTYQKLLKSELGNKEIIEINSEDTHEHVKIVSPYKIAEKSKPNVACAESLNDCSSLVESDIFERKSSSKKQKSESAKSDIRAQKIAVKARSKLSAIKMRQIRNKIPSSVSSGSDFTESDASDAEISDKEEPQNPEASECSVECSKVSVRDVSVAEEKSPNQCQIQQPPSSQLGAGDSEPSWPLRESLFPHVPPYINFNVHDAEVPFSLPSGRRYLKWKLSTITPIVVRKTLTNTGFQLIRKSNEWLGTWGKHMKSPMFRTLKEVQKLNHFPGTFQIGRKDRLWRNLQRLILKYGQKEFGFIPQTFVLPQDLKLLKQCWEHKNGSGGEIFIIKPPASARGVGIRVINKWTQLPKKTAVVVQRYISNPYLINGSKFDLRLYVLVTSFNPLRIYLYPDGLARFASAKYSDNAKDLKDRYMHLTNYSINKLSSQYTANEDANACQGHKWTLSKLWEFMEKDGVDTKALWKNLEVLVIKTMISGESPITMLCKENLTSRYNCYELFGVDVLLDDRLKPWLLEVNISPSLHSASPLDAHVKGPLVKALFDMAQFHLPTRLRKNEKSPPCFDSKLYTLALTKKERNKHNYYTQIEDREEYLDHILEYLTGDDVRHLTQYEDELTVMGPFKKIFPTSQTYKYLPFMEVRYYNRLFDAWECKHEKNRTPGIETLKSLCSQKLHLKVAPQSPATKSLQNMIPVVLNLEPSTEGQSHPYNIDNHLLTTVVSS